MALDDILATIERDTDRAIAELDERVEREEQELRRAMDVRIAAELEELAAERARRCDERVVRVEREARRREEVELRSTRERVLAAFDDDLRSRLREIREDTAYGDILERWLSEAWALLPDASLVRVDPRDAARVEPLAAARGLTVQATLTTWGGVELEGQGGRRIFNTAESRLVASAGELRRTAARTNPVIARTIG